MAQTHPNIACTLRSLGVGLAAGIVVVLLFGMTGASGWGGAVLLGLIVFGVGGGLLAWWKCSPLPSIAQIRGHLSGGTDAPRPPASAATSTGSAAVAAKPGSTAAPKSTTASASASASAPRPASAPSTVAASQGVRSNDAIPAAAEPQHQTAASAPVTAPASGPVAKRAAPSASMTDHPTPSASIAAGQPGTTPKQAPKQAPGPTPATATAPKPAPKVTDASPAGDAGGSRPQRLDAAREGGPDNLKAIKGVGPKLESVLHGIGVFHFDQIAGWGTDEVAWVDQNLEGFKGRVSRDDWVAQARILAGGGTTEFSKKVDRGSVY